MAEVATMEFVAFPKIARLSRESIVTEKIDGTNAQIYIAPVLEAGPPDPFEVAYRAARDFEPHALRMFVGSRTRWITPEKDNFGFAAWARAHADELWALGEGRHFGEWWGSGIQRGYGLSNGEKRFSLFNTGRWGDDRDREKFPGDRPPCCGVVPIIWRGEFDSATVNACVEQLRVEGSLASPGFMNPEGVVVFHSASGTLYKKTLEKDAEPKGFAMAGSR